MNKVNVVYIIPHLNNSGPVKQLLTLIKNMNDIHKILVITLFNESSNSIIDEFKKINIEIVQIKGNRRNPFYIIISLNKILKDRQPQIVHTETVISDVIYSFCDKKGSWITTLHNYVYYDLVMTYGKIKGMILAKLAMNAYKKVDLAIACSRNLYELYLHKIKNLDYVQNGVEKICCSFNKDELREKLNLPQNKTIVISTGVLTERKNPIFLLKSIKKYQSKYDILLLMLGDGNLENECKNYESENIIFTGRVKNVNEYLLASDIFVSASKAEGLPCAVLEAISANLKILLSDIPEHKEIAQEIKDIYLYSSNNGEDFLNKLDECVYEPLHKKDLGPFSGEYMAKKYCEKYKNVVKNL